MADSKNNSGDLTKEGDAYYITSPGCPYAGHYPKEPKNFRQWEQRLNDQLEKGWRKDGAKHGVEVKDHNWVRLGQGGTLGFVAGSLSIGQHKDHNLEKLSDACRQGLFEKPGDYPAIVRFSDAGEDGGSKLERLLRMAIKIQFPDAWCNEINFTTVETLEQFSLEDFDEIGEFVGDPKYTSFFNKLSAKLETLGIAVNAAGELLSEWNSGEVFSKTFYSQLAYLLGSKRAFKYRFVALQDPVGDVEDTAKKSVTAMRQWLQVSDAKYQLEIQVHDDPNSKLVQKKASDRWEAPWIPVGLLTLSRQETDEQGVGLILRDTLIETLKLSGEEAAWLHKSFMFHPLLTDKAHLPVGETQQFRAHFYPRANQHRLSLFSDGKIKPREMPFDTLNGVDAVAELFKPSKETILSTIEAPAAYEKMDRYTKTLCKIILPKVIAAKASQLTDDKLVDSKINLFGPQDSNTINVGKLAIKLIKEDDLLGGTGFAGWLLLRALRTEFLFPLEDVYVDCTAEEETAIAKHLGLVQSLPQPTHHWHEMNSDEAISRMCFSSVGSIMLTAHNEGDTRYVMDTGNLANLKMRPGFRPYGTRAHFDKDRKLLKIYDYANERMVSPQDFDWTHVKHVTKQTLATSVTGEHHLLWCHFLVANIMVNAITVYLPLKHQVRRLLQPFTFRTIYVNNGAKDSLLPEYSMFHHATGMTYASLTDLMEQSAKRCNFWQPFPDTAAALGKELNQLAAEGHFPLITDGLAYYQTVLNLVKSWLAGTYSNDDAVSNDKDIQAFWKSLVKDTAGLAYSVPPTLTSVDQLAATLTQFIFVVTGIHELVGSVVEYVGVQRCGFRARPNATQTDVQSWLITACVMSTTALRTPALMGSMFSNYFADGFESDTWAAFQKDLQKLADANDEINKGREHPFLFFNPRILECAISV